MKPLPRTSRTLYALSVACALALPVFGASSLAWSLEVPLGGAAAGGAGATGGAKVEQVQKFVDDFYHYLQLGRPDLAEGKAKEVLAAGASDAEVLAAFEAVAEVKKEAIDAWMLRAGRVDTLKPSVEELNTVLRRGYLAVRQDPARIAENIKVLGQTRRGYTIGLGRLRESGEYAVPFLVDVLRDPNQRAQHPVIRRALTDLGNISLNPLLAATESKSPEVLIVVTGILGDLEYAEAAPYVAKVAEDKTLPPGVAVAANQALAKLKGAGQKPADLFYKLADNLYYDKSSVKADKRDPKLPAFVWYWAEDKGLTKKDVPQSIFNEVMAMRAAEQVLKLDGSRDDATALWLAANYKREAELPAGAVDATRQENQPPAHFYGVSAGAKYLNIALARAIKDQNAPVALRVVRSLSEIVGASSLFTGAGNEPVVEAIRFPERQVRYEAAAILASAMPAKAFPGQERVVPTLAEAVAQTGAQTVLVLDSDQNRVNVAVKALKDAKFNAVGGTTANAVLGAIGPQTGVDILVINADAAAEADRLLLAVAESPRMNGAVKLIATGAGPSRFKDRAETDRSFAIIGSIEDATAIKTVAEATQKAIGSQPLDEKLATDYALRSADLLGRLAISQLNSGSSVLDLSAAEPSLLGAFSDPRTELVTKAAEVLALYNTRSSQLALSIKAAEAPDGPVKVSLYKSLANNAKRFGNKLDQAQVDSIRKTADSATNPEVKAASAEALGALNLPADQAKALIIQQAR